jgi:hypothetical protein
VDAEDARASDQKINLREPIDRRLEQGLDPDFRRQKPYRGS